MPYQIFVVQTFFSQPVASLFSLLAISVEEEEILILTKSILSTLSPRDQAFCVIYGVSTKGEAVQILHYLLAAGGSCILHLDL